jgi:hypothetical protein
MNAFREHHQHNIRMHYRCFDRILLNGIIQPFQQEERVVGFFNTYRRLYPVSRNVLREIASQFHNWVKDRSQKWQAPWTLRLGGVTSSSIATSSGPRPTKSSAFSRHGNRHAF